MNYSALKNKRAQFREQIQNAALIAFTCFVVVAIVCAWLGAGNIPNY